jgi:hypothetical protein
MGTKINPEKEAPQKAGLPDYLRSLSYPLQSCPPALLCSVCLGKTK